ncbi:MAG TPA: hypothetical protein VFJ85_10585 [Acidimicrobiales bacterium]|nr:hypothetical protein [Acidimicrobiales bacterium]
MDALGHTDAAGAFDVPGGDAGRRLYDLAPSAFTAARDDLVKRLRAGGDRAEAARVAKLHRPPATAWALNRVAHTNPGLVDAVLDAGARLRDATRDALGGDAAGLRTAQTVERSAVDAATAAGAGHLAGAGLGAGEAPRQRMAATLRAAIVDPAVAARLRAGLLEDDWEAPGLGLDAMTGAGAPALRRRPVPEQPAARSEAATAPAEPPAVDPAAAIASARAAATRAADLLDAAEELAAVANTRAEEARAAARAAAERLVEARKASDAALAATAAAETVATRLQGDAEDADAAARAAAGAAETARAEAQQAAALATELEEGAGIAGP